MRAGFGGTPEQIRTVATWGPERAVDHLLDCAPSDAYPWPATDEFDDDIIQPLSQAQRREFFRARQNQDEDTVAKFRERRQQMQRTDRRQARELQQWWLGRLIESPRPLEEKMTLFWHGHFATSYRGTENSYHLFRQNQLFRSQAVGNFAELLLAIIRDPAMLKFLNNDQSRKQEPNENLARELMELFSLGTGQYTERDIKEGARALTGYTFEHNDFVFQRTRHDNGVKTILGARGSLDGEDFVRAILAKRACSEFICAKLYRFFVGDIPEGDSGRERQRVVREMASKLRASKYELKPVLRQLFLSEHFHDPSNRLTQIKSPVELVVGAIRSLRTPSRSLGVLNKSLELMGQHLFMPPNVKGWDGGRTWINTSTLFVRQNVITYLLTGEVPNGIGRGRSKMGGVFNRRGRFSKERGGFVPSQLLEELGALRAGHDQLADALLDHMLEGAQVDGRRDALIKFALENEDLPRHQIAVGMMNLIGAMPEYQLA